MVKVLKRNRRFILGLLVALLVCGGVRTVLARSVTCTTEGEQCGCLFQWRNCANCGAVGCSIWGSDCQWDCKDCGSGWECQRWQAWMVR